MNCFLSKHIMKRFLRLFYFYLCINMNALLSVILRKLRYNSLCHGIGHIKRIPFDVSKCIDAVREITGYHIRSISL